MWFLSSNIREIQKRLMELNSTWSPSWAHPTESWLARGPGATPSPREASYWLRPNEANPPPALLLLCASSQSERRSCPSWDFPRGSHSQAWAVTLPLPKRQTHVSTSPPPKLMDAFSFTRELLSLLGVPPQNERYSSSNKNVARGSLTNCPNLPSPPPLPYPHQEWF